MWRLVSKSISVVVLVAVVPACGGRSQRTAEETGGTSGDGGAGFSAGAVSGGGGSAGKGGNGGNGGSSGAVGVAGTAGMASGGTSSGQGGTGVAGSIAIGGASSGASGAGGSNLCGNVGADPIAPQACLPVAAQTPLITDFADWNEVEGRWGGDPSIHALTGGIYVYDSFGGTSLTGQPSAAERSWTIRGVVQWYSGFGLWFDVRRLSEGFCAYNCLDAAMSGCEGIVFTLEGALPAATPALDVVLDIWDDRPNEVGLPGGCMFWSEETKYSDCVQPFVQIAPATERMEYRLAFEEFTGGKPLLENEGDQLIGLRFELPWSVGAPSYDVVLTLSNVAFYGQGACTLPTLR